MNQSTVTTIDPQPSSLQDNSSAQPAIASASCQSSGPMKTLSTATAESSKSRHKRWLTWATISAAITVAIAPLSIGALQQNATSPREARLPSPEAIAVEITPSPDATDTHSTVSQTEPATEFQDGPITEPTPETVWNERDFVALREPTEDGERVRIVVFEPNRDLYIHESAQDGIQIRVRRYLFGTSTEQMVSAADVQELKEQSQEAFEIYQTHIDKAHLLSPAVSIYPAEEVAWLQPSGFLTAMSIDETKGKTKKEATSKNSKSSKKDATDKKAEMKKSTSSKKSDATPKAEGAKKGKTHEKGNTAKKNDKKNDKAKKSSSNTQSSSKEKMTSQKSTNKPGKGTQTNASTSSAKKKDSESKSKAEAKDEKSKKPTAKTDRSNKDSDKSNPKSKSNSKTKPVSTKSHDGRLPNTHPGEDLSQLALQLST